MTSCPCGTGLALEACCGPIMDGATAASPEALLRARYSAFAIRRIDSFMNDTITPEMRAEFDPKAVEQSARDAEALGLEIRATSGGGDEDTGTVEYVARFRVRGQIQAHHELATFHRVDGAWLYADAVVNPKAAPRQVVKVGRNDPCPCGSGQKFKKCCGA